MTTACGVTLANNTFNTDIGQHRIIQCSTTVHSHCVNLVIDYSMSLYLCMGMSADGSEEEDDEDLEQQDSIFSRLEELRFHLEQAMGFENFIQAYNKIKV